MKKILFFILIVISIQSFGQLGYQVRKVNERLQGKFMVDSVFNIPRYYDTTAANLHKGVDTCGAMFFSYAKDSIYIRLCNPKKWITVGSGQGLNFANANLTQTSARTYAGAGFNYTLNNLGEWNFNMANGSNFYVNNASSILLNASTNNWGMLGKSGAADGVYIQGEGDVFFDNALYIYSGLTSTRNSQFRIYPDSMSIMPGGNGKINIDSLRNATTGDYVWTWDAGGMVGKMPTVKYNFTGLADWDKLRYNSSTTEWNNFNSTRIDPDDPKIKMLVKDTTDNKEWYTDIPTGIEELDAISDLDDFTGNAALIDGRLWVKSGTDWRRQAYDTTYTAPLLLLDAYTGALGAYSLRKLRAAQTNCIRVRRISDDAEQDIGFDGNVIDETSLVTFIGGSSGRVVKWYDQSGNSNNLDNSATPTSQPFIVVSGTVLTDNGKPTLDFGAHSTIYYLTLPTGFLNGATSLSYFQVAKITDYASSNAGVFGPNSTNSVGLEVLQHTVATFRSMVRINGTTRNANTGAAYQLWDDATQSLTSIFGNSTDVTAYKNSASVTLTTSTAMPALNYNGVYALGFYDNGGNDMAGRVQELIIYSANKTSSRTGIETNINTYYTIY